MKKMFLGLGLFISSISAYAQNGLECVVIEKYYISNAADAIAADDDLSNAGYTTGTLPAGSVTYRIYADMLPGYKFQALYGSYDVNQTYYHPLRFKTTTKFYNNSNGNTSPSWTKSSCKNNVLALDSWLSVGAAANGQFGVLKTDDNGTANNVTLAGNSDSVLLNNNSAAGIPLLSQDGLLTGTPQAVTLVGITNQLDVFGDGSIAGDSIFIIDGSISSLNGSTGPASDNKVLIAQLTTDGVLTFSLNLQVGTPSGGTENYVAQNPYAGMNEILLDCYTYIGIQEQEPTSSLQVFKAYPNPVSDILNIELSPSKSNFNICTIRSIDGKVILSKRFGPQTEKSTEHVDLSSLANGIYIIELSNNGFTSFNKIIKN